jgi:hypothetical protein
LNIFSHFSRDEIGKLVEELCRTGLHFVAANQTELEKQKGWREVIFYPRSDDFRHFSRTNNEVKLAHPLITRLLQAIDDMRSVAGCTASNAHSDGKSVRFRQIECCMFKTTAMATSSTFSTRTTAPRRAPTSAQFISLSAPPLSSWTASLPAPCSQSLVDVNRPLVAVWLDWP